MLPKNSSYITASSKSVSGIITQKRSISFNFISSIFRKNSSSSNSYNKNEITKPLTELSEKTGAGPFAEPVGFEVLGNLSNLLNISLPSSSILNLRYNNKNQSIIAMNGKIKDLYVELGKIDSKNQLDPSVSNNLLFQRCFNTENPMTLLLSNKITNSNFSIIDLKESDDHKWIITSKDNLVAWTGNYLNLSFPTRNLLSANNNSVPDISLKNSIVSEGKGKIALSSLGQLLQVKLNEGESVSLIASSVIAYTTPKDASEKINQSTASVKSLVDLTVPQFPLLTKSNIILKSIFKESFKFIESSLLKIGIKFPERIIPKEFTESPIIKSISSYSSKIFSVLTSNSKRLLTKLVSGSDDIMIELNGPRSVILSNAVYPANKVFSKKQLNSLYR
ncbi:hypothetical protein BVG19_g1785 [[Candida] boidinii]|nr:hypothetical protein BVG19_g1785 [[Candida] boidinii]OWB53626.1 hypothetical protein B5S27_g5231 [[Candida] boidinii]